MQNTGLQSEDLGIIGSFLEEHIIFPAGQHKIILWNRLTIINIYLLWTTSKQCSFSSSVCKKNKTVTCHSPFKQEVEFALCFRIQTNKAFFRSSKNMSSIAFLSFIMTARTWSRCYPTSIEKNGTIRFGTGVSRKKHFVSQVVHVLP